LAATRQNDLRALTVSKETERVPGPAGRPASKIIGTTIIVSPIMFWNRKQELAALGELDNGGGLAVVWGRRRIGKTRRLLEWSERAGGVYTLPATLPASFATGVKYKCTGAPKALRDDARPGRVPCAAAFAQAFLRTHSIEPNSHFEPQSPPN
jgi:hypothetical protein